MHEDFEQAENLPAFLTIGLSIINSIDKQPLEKSIWKFIGPYNLVDVTSIVDL